MRREASTRRGNPVGPGRKPASERPRTCRERPEPRPREEERSGDGKRSSGCGRGKALRQERRNGHGDGYRRGIFSPTHRHPRVSRNWGSWPGSLGRAQWQVGLPQRRTTAVAEQGRRSPKPRNSSRSLERSASKAARVRHGSLLDERIYTLRNIEQKRRLVNP